MNLSAEQLQAVERNGQDVCVVAGPGSGKTRVLTERFAWLVEHWGTEPSRILAITFTEKAAIEIKQRLIKRFVNSPEHREAVERAWVSTIHGFCSRLLKEHAIAAGLSPDFTVLEQAPADQMERAAAEAALDALFAERPSEMRRLMEAVDLSTMDDGRQDDLAGALLKIYEGMRTSGGQEVPAPSSPGDVLPQARDLARDLLGTPVAEWVASFLALPDGPPTLKHLALLAEFKPDLGKYRKHPAAKELRDVVKPQLEAQWLAAMNADLHELLRTALQRIDVEYRARKRGAAVLDFSDLEEFAVRLLESDVAVLFETRAKFDEVLMDELQDTNPVQWKLVEMVKSRLFAVGDINQSIYGFRYADPTLFARYRDGLREDGWQIDELRDNYRSRSPILSVVSSMLNGRPGIEHRELIARGDFAPTSDPVVERFEAHGDQRYEVEAAMVAERIQAWRAAGKFHYKDIALLVRTFAAAEPFERVFDAAGIPFLLSGGRGFLEGRETRDMLNLLAALVNVHDEIPLLGVLRGPLVGLSDEELYGMGRAGWRQVFEERFGSLRQLAGFVAPDQLIARALDACDYRAKLNDRARANVDKLLAWIRNEYGRRSHTLAELLDSLEALRDAEAASNAPPPEAGDVVRIMTIHAAKGLEFPVVFVSGLHKGPNRSHPALLFSSTEGLGVKWRNPITGDGASDPMHRRLKEQVTAREAGEADRLLYVAMTRAEQRLILTHVEQKRNVSDWVKLAKAALPEALVATDPPAAPQLANETQMEEDALLPAPVVTDQYDSTASVTSVALFAACPRRYYLSRYLGLEAEPDGPGTGAIATGLNVHAVLAGQPAASPEVQKLADNFTNSEWGQRAARAQRVQREFDFLFACDDMILRGQIDLWFEEAGELVLVDYKTDRDESSAENYALQLRLYALGLEPYAGRVPDRAILFYVRSGRVIEVSLSGEHLENARGRIGELRAAQERLEFPLRPGDQCQKCSFLSGLCPEGRGGKVTAGLVFGPPSSFLVPASGGS